jgi:hypothetical protein
MSGPESKVEDYLKSELERYGFSVIKFVPQGCAGVPDRWIFRPKWSPGEPMCVEIKAGGRGLRRLQTEVGVDLLERGVKVLPYIDSKTKVDMLVTKLVRLCVNEADLVARAQFPSHIIRRANLS